MNSTPHFIKNVSNSLKQTVHPLGTLVTGTKVGKVLIMEDAELKTTVDIISLIENSNVSLSSVSETELSESIHGCRTAEHREVSALISFKGTVFQLRENYSI